MTVKPSRVPYLEIAADIREQIRSGRLAPGDQLKTVRALAADYSVAQGTVGAAMEVLRGEGLIDTVRGKGSVVIAVPAEPGAGPETAWRSALQEMETRLAGEIAEVREEVERLQAQMMAVYAREGKAYPYEADPASQGRGVG